MNLKNVEQNMNSTGYTIESNPFYISDKLHMFGYQEAKSLKIKEERQSMKSLSLVDRTGLLKPRVPSSLYRTLPNTRSPLYSAKSNSSFIRRKKESQERFQRMTEFIQQKREIYVVQLLIDKKGEEIEKINDSIIGDEKQMNEEEIQISDTAQRYKMMTTKIEADLAKGRKSAEHMTQQRVELLQRFKRQTTNNAIIKSEISKNEETLESYILYHDFLSQWPDGPGWFLSDPNIMINELARIESENLFLIRQCEQITESKRGETKDYNQLFNDLERIIESIEHSREKSLNFPMQGQEPNEVESIEDIESLISSYTSIIEKTYKSCFKKRADVTPITMLERIENRLEEMYQEITLVEPAFVDAKQLQREKERREEQRKLMQKEKERLQQEKKDQALARATKPIKKREGRPLVARTIPFKAHKNDDEIQRLLLLGMEKQQALLFGSPYE